MILGQNIDRSQLPTLTMRQMNPSHTYQSMQDLLSAKLGMAQPQAAQPAPDTSNGGNQ